MKIRGGYSPNSHFIWYFNDIPPIKQPLRGLFINPGLTLHCISYVSMMPLTCGWMIQTESSCLTSGISRVFLHSMRLGAQPAPEPEGTQLHHGRVLKAWDITKKQRGINNPAEWWERTSIMVHWCTSLLQEKMHITNTRVNHPPVDHGSSPWNNNIANDLHHKASPVVNWYIKWLLVDITPSNCRYILSKS